MEPFDHKRLGREMRIFAQDDQIGRGLPLWLPNGSILRDELEKLMRELEFKAGYHRVSTPHLARESLYARSGHLEFFAENMYPALDVGDGEVYRLRPMNCPHHHRVFDSELRSYRDLPLRLAEYGQAYRLEESGALSGLARVRGLCINDAHIYCRRDQVREELKLVMRMHIEAYRILGIDDFKARLSKHEPGAKFVDAPEEWAWAEGVLRDVLVDLGLSFDEVAGEAAFYGPKIDWQLISAGGKEFTVSTCQIDFVSAERMGLSYVAVNGERERPIVLHRAPLGSHERMVAFLLEKYRGHFPSWLAPQQVRILPVGAAERERAKEVEAALRSRFLRADVDASEESLGKRMREALGARIPHVLVIGQKEVSSGEVAYRGRLHSGQVAMEVDALVRELEALVQNRVLD